MRTGNRERVIERGLELVHEQGFNATGVQEIADAAGIPKGSFYSYFASKEDFGTAILNRYADASCADLERRLIRAGGSPLDRLRAVFRDWTEESETRDCSRGCLAGNLCQEMADSSPALRIAVDGVFRRIEGYLAACLREAQAAGELSRDEDPDELASSLEFAWQGAVMRAKASRSAAPMRGFQEVILPRLLR